jgi:hypothetical protein
MSYVIVQNGQYVKPGVARPLRGFGINRYGLAQDNLSMSTIDNFMAWCASRRARFVRFWLYGKTGPAQANNAGYPRWLNGTTLTWNENFFVSVDRIFDSAARHGILLSPVFADNWPEFSDWGHKQEYCYWSNTIHGTAYDRHNNGDDFFLDTNIKGMYKAFLQKLATRTNTINGRLYSQDPTMMRGELINEPRFTSGVDTNVGTLNSYRVGVMNNWITEMAAYWKTVFPNHLVTVGGITQFHDYTENDPVHNSTFYGLDYPTQHKIPNINGYSAHGYFLEDSPDFRLKAMGQSLGNSGRTAKGLIDQTKEFIDIAVADGEPFDWGELGIDKRATVATAIPTYPRDQFIRGYAPTFFSLGGAIIWWWHASTSEFDDNNYNALLTGVHTGGNANSNDNDNDANFWKAIEEIDQALNGERIQITPTKITGTPTQITPRQI